MILFLSVIWFGFKKLLIPFTVVLISQVLGDLALTCCPDLAFFVKWFDLIVSYMDGFPLSLGGDGSGASSSTSKRPRFDLNLPPVIEIDPQTAPLEPSPEEEESRRERGFGPPRNSWLSKDTTTGGTHA